MENTTSVAYYFKGCVIMTKKNSEESTEIAGRVYQPSDYEKKDQLSSGLATTHEQVSDTLAEGDIESITKKGRNQ